MPAIALIEHGALPAVRLTSTDGAQAILTLYGAHLVSWITADGKERLFCSALSSMDGSRAIRGGVPVIFPQFAERGSGMRHGFARVSTWRLVDSGAEAGAGAVAGAAFAVFALDQNDLAQAHGAAWPHRFALTLRVALKGGKIALSLDVQNTGSEAFAFSSALHTYFAVDELGQVAVRGVQEDALRLDDKLDRIFHNIGGPITLEQPGGALRLAQQGFLDAVVWNPGAQDAAALADMEDDEYRRFICIEAALIDQRTLAPGAGWTGTHDISSIP